MKKVLGTLTKRIIEALGLSVALCLALYLAVLCVFPFPYDALKHIKYSQCIFDRNGNLIRVFAGQDDSRLMPIDVKEINPNLVNATLAIEDNRFRSHHGVDLFAVLRAVRLNVTNQKTISGASTISMQVIRIAENRKRSYFNKAIEAVHAIRLETLYSKEEILRFYFELAPYGGNIRGVKAAALRYFKKYPQDLTLSECAL
ncbi:MAG: transglycosylase domain-containing protein [Candidatus Omnitrophota bacterium]